MAIKVSPTATVTYDGPAADGRVLTFGVQGDYQFAPPSENGAFGGAQDTWPVYTASEYLPALGCIRPRGQAYLTDMALGATEWSVETGKWRVTKPSIMAGRTAFLDYYNAAPDGYGSIIHNQPHLPNMAAAIIRNAPAANTTGWPNYLAFEFLGHPGDPVDSRRKKFAFIFPVGDPTYKYPVLTMDAVGSGTYTPVAYWANGESRTASGNGVETDEIWFEWIDGGFHIRRSGVQEPWVYRPADGDYAVGSGYVRVYVYGHACMVWFGDITYDAASSVTNNRYEYVNSATFSTEREWHVHSWNPDPRWTITPSEELNPADADQFRPLLTITQGNGSASRPPAVWVTSYAAEATQGGASTSPVALDKDNGYSVEAITYDLDQTGRGQTCEIMIRDTPGTLPWKGNEKITAVVGWNQDDGTTDTAQKFLGYISRLPKSGDALKDKVGTTVSIGVGDPIDARLSKKFMVNKSAAGQTAKADPDAGATDDLANWVYRILFDAGAPAAQLTSIYAMIGQPTTPTIPQGQPKGDLRFRFSADVCVIDALDDVCTACGREWGWNAETGLYFLRAPVTYSGTPDWTLDDDTQTALNAAQRIAHESSPEEYRNVLYAISETLGEAWSDLWIDEASRTTTNDASYVGDDWWEVLVAGDGPTGNAAVAKRWAELLKQHSVITWTMRGRTDLGPGKFIKAQVTKLGVTMDAIYQVVHEHGEIKWGTDDPVYTITLTARIWETS